MKNISLQEQMTRRDKIVKDQVIEMLIEEGYGTYAKRLKEFDFLVTDFCHGNYIKVACMFPDTGEICINPDFLKDEKSFKQVSVVVRHELLHFLLVHEKRFYDHLKKTDPDFARSYRKASIHELANYAMDWELSDIGYDDHDKEVVRLMQLNGDILGGLILSDDHPEWVNKPMEELFDLIRQEQEPFLNQDADGNIAGTGGAGNLSGDSDGDGTGAPQGSTSGPKIPQAYADAWNEIMAKFDKDEVTEQELMDLIQAISDGTITEI